MTNQLMSAITSPAAQKARKEQSSELKTALTFARLEVAELQAGIRNLKDCPGILQLAEIIKAAK
jgi:hypothetical protein